MRGRRPDLPSYRALPHRSTLPAVIRLAPAPACVKLALARVAVALAQLAAALACTALALAVVSAPAGAAALSSPTVAARARTAQAQAPSVSPSAIPVTVSIEPNHPGRVVAQRFLGLSFEMAALPQIAQFAHNGDFVALLRSLGPGMLRFGGITADENVAWTDALTPKPAWATSTIDAADLRALAAIARASDWQVLLTVGMAHYEPQAAAREVAAAHRALGPYLAAVEIGNEPDSYGAHGYRALPWIAQGYEEQVTGYREAIEALTPNVPIAGPDVSGSGVFTEWGEEEALAQQPVLLTGHHYPLGCAQTPPPSIEALLSPETRGREARSLATYMAVSLLRSIPLRIDETNSVSCGGVPGISDTFASSLWASAYITQAMAAGAAGINLQGNPTNCPGYTPVCAPDTVALAAGALHPQPDWYALLVTRSLVGTRPLPATIAPLGSGAGGQAIVPNLVVAPFAGPGGTLQVVIVDDEAQGAQPLELHLNVPAGLTVGHVTRLTGPALTATSGVRLGGRQVNADGTLPTLPAGAAIPVSAGRIAVEVSPSSAALLTVTAPPATHGHRHRRRSHSRR